MAKKSYNWLKVIQEGKGKEFSRFFFDKLTTEEKATIEFYPKTHKKNSKKYSKEKRKYRTVHYIDKNINRLCKEWEKEKLLEKYSVSITVSDRWKGEHKQRVIRKIMGLNPFYRYCKEIHNIEFTEKEIKFINILFSPNSQTRWLCLEEYPNDDIINAILKFYIKYCPMPYNEMYRIETLFKYPNMSLAKDYIEILKRAKQDMEEVANLDINKIEEIPHKAEDYFEEINKQTESKNLDKIAKIEAVTKNLIKAILYGVSSVYLINVKKNPDVVASVDSKFMKVLGILPSKLPKISFLKTP